MAYKVSDIWQKNKIDSALLSYTLPQSMSSGKKGRGKRRRTARRSSISSPQQTPEPKFLKPCKNLLNQITAMDDCKDFRKLISTQNKVYREYTKINSSPISFSYVLHVIAANVRKDKHNIMITIYRDNSYSIIWNTVSL